MQPNSFSIAAPDYDAHALMQRRVAEKLASALIPLLNTTDYIIDAGCGTGALAQLLKTNRMIQLDNAYGMCVLAARHAPALCADANALPIRAKTMDAYASSLCWQWADDLPTVIKEACTVLKKRGLLAVATLLNGSCSRLYQLLNEYDLPLHTPKYPEYEHLREMFQDAGAEIIREESWHEMQHFPTSFAMMRSFHDIGATLPASKRNMTALRHVLRTYQQMHGHDAGVTMTYHLGLFIARMPS